jgi:hypothetical protein
LSPASLARAARPRSALAPLALAAALAATSAAAQGKEAAAFPRPTSPRSAPPAGRTQPAAAPLAPLAGRAQPAVAPRAPVAAATAIPLPPPPAGTTLQRRSTEGWLGLAVGPHAAFSSGDSIALHADYGVLRTPAGWRRLTLEYRLAFLLARPEDETALTRFIPSPYGPSYPGTQVPSGVERARAWVVEVVPTARVRVAWEKFALFADGGLGLVQTLERYEREESFVGRSERTENVTGLVLRAGAGMSFDLSPRTRLLLQPLAFSFQIGPELSAYTPSLGLSYRL